MNASATKENARKYLTQMSFKDIPAVHIRVFPILERNQDNF